MSYQLRPETIQHIEDFKTRLLALPESVRQQLQLHWDDCKPFVAHGVPDVLDLRSQSLRVSSVVEEAAFLESLQDMIAVVEAVHTKIVEPDVLLPSQKTLGMISQLKSRVRALPEHARDTLFKFWERDAEHASKMSPLSAFNPSTGELRLGSDADEQLLQTEIEGMLQAVDNAYRTLPTTDINVTEAKMFKSETMVQLTVLRNRAELLPSFTLQILEERWRKRDRSIHMLFDPRDGQNGLAMPQTVADEEELQAEIRRQLNEVDDELVKIQYQRNVSHVVALEQQLLAYRVNALMMSQGVERKRTGLQRATLAALKSARPYCWSPQCVEAVATKASLLSEESRPGELPHDCKLVQPAECGWWWFERPLPLKTTQGGEPVVALCWRREVRQGPVEILDAMGMEKVLDHDGPISLTWFSAFVHDPVEVAGRTMLAPNPTLAWLWIDNVPIGEHMQNVRERFSELSRQKLMGLESASDEESAHAAVWLSKFWLSAAVWLNSRIIGHQSMALPRQQGRQIMRQHNLEKPPLVEVVYLRRPEPKPYDPLKPASTEPKHHDYHWLVEEFPRRQWYPSKGRHELILVREHRRGPLDKPLKNAVKIYAVNR